MAVYGWQQADADKSRLDAKFNDTILYSMNSTGISFYNQAPVARPSAYTQTYSTADKTHATMTAPSSITNSVGTGNDAVVDVTSSFSQSVLNDNFRDITDVVNELINDVIDVKNLVNSVIDDLQALGLVQ